LRFVRPGVTAKSAALVAELPRNALAGRRLLIIDDEADTRSFLHRVLTERGAQVAVAHNAADGLRRTLADKPEAVICDISMPGEDGYSFIRHLRRVTENGVKATPAAALTALARAEDRPASHRRWIRRTLRETHRASGARGTCCSPAGNAQQLLGVTRRCRGSLLVGGPGLLMRASSED
jgi:CheY-like chemotaxis protein